MFIKGVKVHPNDFIMVSGRFVRVLLVNDHEARGVMVGNTGSMQSVLLSDKLNERYTLISTKYKLGILGLYMARLTAQYGTFKPSFNFSRKGVLYNVVWDLRAGRKSLRVRIGPLYGEIHVSMDNGTHGARAQAFNLVGALKIIKNFFA